MPFTIIRNDITKLRVDAIVNAANTSLQMGGGVCGAIFSAAGADRLQKACDALAPIKTGEAVITHGFDLPAKYIIHTAGPVYIDGKHGEEALLRSCYTNSLELAVKHDCESIAFPLISSGIYGYPKAGALRAATAAILDFIGKNDIDVSLVVFDKEALAVSEKLIGAIDSYIDEHYVEEKERRHSRKALTELEGQAFKDAGVMNADMQTLPAVKDSIVEYNHAPAKHDPAEYTPAKRTPAKPAPAKPVPAKHTPTEHTPTERITAEHAQLRHTPLGRAPAERVSLEHAPAERSPAAASVDGFKDSLDDIVVNLDEPFSSTLLRLIDAAGKKDADIYRRANIDRRLFSKIRSNENYAPSKTTVLALAVALELTLGQTVDLLRRAGFALSRSRKLDVIVEYFILSRKYDIFEINEVLFRYDQPLLGGN